MSPYVCQASQTRFLCPIRQETQFRNPLTLLLHAVSTLSGENLSRFSTSQGWTRKELKNTGNGMWKVFVRYSLRLVTIVQRSIETRSRFKGRNNRILSFSNINQKNNFSFTQIILVNSSVLSVICYHTNFPFASVLVFEIYHTSLSKHFCLFHHYHYSMFINKLNKF